MTKERFGTLLVLVQRSVANAEAMENSWGNDDWSKLMSIYDRFECKSLSI
jgi:hypothetical protein